MKHWDKYDIGGSIESDLEAFDVSKLDAFEQMQYSDLIKHSTKAEALKILINNVEGDFSQLSPNLSDIAEMYYPEDNYFMDDNYADGGKVFKMAKLSMKPYAFKEKIKFVKENPEILAGKFADGGGVKTDFNDLNNEGLRKALISFREDFNNFLSNYLQVGKENYILSNIDNVMVIFRDKSLRDFSDVENVAINKWIQPYFDITKKPLIAEYLNGYKIDGNRIIIYIKDSQMYANGGVSLKFTSKTLTKSKESKLKERLFDGRISEVDLKNIIGFEPNYPTQIVGTIKLEKCFLLPYYKII